MVAQHNHTVTPVSILSNEEVSEGVFLLSFQRHFVFRAGQVIGIALAQDGPRRLYSICSGEEESTVKILYNVIEEGYLTPRLCDTDSMDTIWITEPRGEFLSDHSPAVWVATGTGIAPFYSMLKSGMAENKVLIHGNRYLDQFHFFDEFSEEMHENFIRCCSGEENHEVFHGRVTDYLLQQDWLDPDLKYYLCGSAEMVVDTRDILIQKGIPFDKIISEIYF